MVDQDDLQSERYIEPNGRELILLEWTPVDANPDRGRLVIIDADGRETAIAIETPDIDPSMLIRAEPIGTTDENGLQLKFFDAAPNRTQRATVTLESASLAPLELNTICLLNVSGDCETSAVLDGFVVCAGNVVEPTECEPVEAPEDALALGDQYTFTIFFVADAMSLDLRTRRIRIENNSLEPSVFH